MLKNIFSLFQNKVSVDFVVDMNENGPEEMITDPFEISESQISGSEMKEDAEQIGTIEIPPIFPLHIENGRVSVEVIEFLQKTFGGEVRVTGGGAKKNSMNISDVVCLITNSKDPQIQKRIEAQVGFYEKYAKLIQESGLVVPMSKKIHHNTELVGMAQENYGKPLNEFIKEGGKITQEQIDQFISRYQSFVSTTGIAHDDLWVGESEIIIWDHLRVDPTDSANPLRFIDYSETGSEVTRRPGTLDPQFDNGVPQNPDYIAHSQRDPARLKTFLYTFLIGK